MCSGCKNAVIAAAVAFAGFGALQNSQAESIQNGAPQVVDDLQNAGNKNANPGFKFTVPPLDISKDILTRTGTQGTGMNSLWGSTNPDDDLLIDGPMDSQFRLKEVSITENSGNAVPLPSAAWQSVAGLVVLGVIGVSRQMKNRRAA